MFSLKDLKEKIRVTDGTVECPVKDCTVGVERQKKVFKPEKRYQCPVHGIFISPSTFEYPCEEENLLWKEKADLDLLSRIKAVKRESRIARDNSEDALTWNVFRYLEKNSLTRIFLQNLAGMRQEKPETIYWSYSQSENDTWTMLNKAREEFGEATGRGSEPDLIIVTDSALFFIEAKLNSGNETKPSRPDDHKKYETGGQSWYSQAFKSGYAAIAIREKKYELMRLWLLGTWAAGQLNKSFYLANLVLQDREKHIEDGFKRHVIENDNRRFVRATWERIYRLIGQTGQNQNREAMTRYFENKTLGYDSDGRIQKAFST